VKLSRKLRYACRVMAQLTYYQKRGKLAHIDELAEREAIPANYLVQILNELRNAGLISSKRGKQGGYTLSRLPELIGLSEIVAAVDSELLENRLEVEGHSGARVASVWEAIGEELQVAISRYTLESFVADESSHMYYI